MKQATLILALLGAIALAGCGSSDHTIWTTYYNGGGNVPYKPVSHLLHRSIVSNYFGGDLQMVDATSDQLTTFSFATGSMPTYLQSSSDGLYTLVNNTGSSSLSTFDNLQEKVRATSQLGGTTQSFVISQNDQSGFAAVPSYSNGNPPILPGAISRFNPFDGSLYLAIPFPYATYLAMDPAQQHLLVFTVADTAAPNGDDNAYLVDLTTNDPTTNFPAISVLNLPAGALSHPVAAFFSADSTTAYILNCGTECGGSSPASVTEINAIGATNLASYPTPSGSYLPSIHLDTATVVNQWMVNGARRGLIDLTANKLYVAGSTTVLADSGGNNVLDGYFTTIDLTAGTASAPIRIGNGSKTLIRSINGNFWVGSLDCGVQSCISIVNPANATASVLPNAYGNGTGIAYQPINNQIFTIEGGQLYIYGQGGNQIISQYNTDIKGQGYDVIYIN